MDSKKNMIVLFLVVTFFAPNNATAETIGLFFDQNGDLPYFNPIDAEYPIHLDLYCIAKDINPDFGLNGWELRIGWTDSLFVSHSEIYGQAINVGTFPNYIVGLGHSLGVGTGRAILAKLSVLATGPGELTIHSSSPPSIPGTQAPIYTRNSSIGFFALEFGGDGNPSAAIGSTISFPNYPGLTMGSRITAFNVKSDGVYGYISDQKSWTKLPTWELGMPPDISDEQFDVIRLIPQQNGQRKRKPKSRGEVIFEEDFNGYYWGAGEPFSPQPGNQKKMKSETHGEDENSCRSYWGVVKDYPNDNLEAFATAASGCNCSNFINGEGCSWNTYSHPGFNSEVISRLMITPEYNFAIESDRTFKLDFDCRSSGLNENWDHMLITYSYTNSEGDLVIVGIGAITTNMIAYDHVSFAISFTGQDHDDGLIDWVFESFNSNYDGGVYMDNILVTEHNADLEISSVYVQATDVPISEPIPVELTIRNNGPWDWATGDFNVGYSIGSSIEVHHLGRVASLSGGQYANETFEIPFQVESKSFEYDIIRSINFHVDSDNEVSELDEDNNIYENVGLTWTTDNAPVILVHGFLGGAIEKSGTQIYGEDFNHILNTMVFTDDLLRSNTTNGEFDDAMGDARVPNPYSPENGFLRNVELSVPLYSYGLVSGDLGGEDVEVLWPIQGGMWEPLIEKLNNNPSYPSQSFVIPENMPQNIPHEQDIFLFNYDWRVDLNPSRGSLNGSTASYVKLDSLITWIQEHHDGADKLTVVSHSMGGLFIQGYIRRHQDLVLDHGIKRWITLGSPFQGSCKAMASLFGEKGLSIAGIPLFKNKNGELVKNFVSGWELLPTSNFDENAPTLAYWANHAPFALGNECEWPCPEYPNQNYRDFQTMETIISNGAFHGWKHNTDSRSYSNNFRNLYMSMAVNKQIENVDIWSIVGCNVPTLRGVLRYNKELLWVPPPFTAPIRLAHDLVFASGDGTVDQWSAQTANVDSVKLVFANGVNHMDLIRDPLIAEFISELVRGHDVDSYFTPLQLWNYPASFQLSEEPWSIVWHTDAKMWSNKSGEKSEMEVMPVSLELVDRDSGKLLVGLVYTGTPQGPIGNGEAWSFLTSLDPRFQIMKIEDEVMIYSNCMETLNLRLRVQPSPELWDPVLGPPARSELFVIGHLQLLEPNRNWQWPDYASGRSYLEFISLGDKGFSAFVDFQMHGGTLNQNAIWPDLSVDDNGDGVPEYIVTGVEANEEEVTNKLTFSVKPNPLNGGTRIQWSLSGGEVRRVRVYDVSGQVVRTLEVDSSKSGQIYFDGRNDEGHELPSGVYFVSLVGPRGQMVATQKLTVLK